MIKFEAKDTAFHRNHSFSCGGRTLNRQGPLLMGILNITPDSFYGGSRVVTADEIIRKAGQMLSEGADILDIGAMSTRPGAAEISEEEELERLLPALRLIMQHFPDCFVSVDTWRAEVARRSLELGAFMINDISGGTFDAAMAELIGRNDVPYIMMHIKGRPADMQANPIGAGDVLDEVKAFFNQQLELFGQYGSRQLITDPGFGFGKTMEANYLMLSKLPELRAGNFPQLVGISRKSMIYKRLSINVEDALNGTTALNTLALMFGADILRVHDVKEARQTIELLKTLTEVSG
ncbi:MAG TPA: dihydropteroate synthase [Bacteroidales bacterium]|nr:dihydropteroate synthase [Bacteroidales bacterium]